MVLFYNLNCFNILLFEYLVDIFMYREHCNNLAVSDLIYHFRIQMVVWFGLVWSGFMAYQPL